MVLQLLDRRERWSETRLLVGYCCLNTPLTQSKRLPSNSTLLTPTHGVPSRSTVSDDGTSLGANENDPPDVVGGAGAGTSLLLVTVVVTATLEDDDAGATGSSLSPQPATANNVNPPITSTSPLMRRTLHIGHAECRP